MHFPLNWGGLVKTNLLVILSQIVAIIAGISALFLAGRIFLHWQQSRYRSAQKFVLLQIRVSKENEKLPIVAEQMFAVLHGTLHDIPLLDRLQGVAPDSFSFEVAHVDGQIKFFAYLPAHLRDFIENQIYAQYPDVEIVEVKDYASEAAMSIRQPEPISAEAADSQELTAPETSPANPAEFDSVDFFQNSYGAELTLVDPHIYPIKRYAQFEDKITRTAVDPLSGITSALMKLPNANDRAMVQIVARPLGDWWRIRATKCARILGKNIFFGIEKLQKKYAWAFMTRKLWPRFIFFVPFYFIMWVQGLLAGTSIKLSISGEGGGFDDVLDETTNRAHDRESSLDAVMDKVVKLPFDCSVRVVYVPSNPDKQVAKVKVRELAGAFKQFNQPHLNGFKVSEAGGAVILDRYRARELHESFVLNTEELATVFHLPNIEVKTPNIYWVTSKKLEPPVDLPDPTKETSITTLGQSNYRGVDKLFGIRTEDRRRHIYVIGKTGMGKSTLLDNMILSDIQAGKGVAVVDPHGDLADHILDNIPSNRTNDVIVFDPSDRDHPVAFNMLENIDPAMNSVVASGLVGIFKKLYADSWGPRLEHILRNTILSLLEYPNTTMLGIPRILADADFRRRVVRKISDPIVKKFWADEFEKMHERQRTEAISPIQNKVGQFLSSSIIRNIVGQPKSMIDLRYVMDNKKIFVCNLSKGKIGEDNSSLLGSMIITKFQLDAMSRSNIPEKDRTDFYLYVDEFQNFATDSFATILSEARKYRLNLTMANQYIAQMSEEVQDAVFGNVGTLMSFQVGYDDAEAISKQFSEIALPNDLVQLPKYNLYAKLLIDGMPSQPFSAATLSPAEGAVEDGRRDKVIRLSRERYAKPRAVVEDKIKRWSEGGDREEVDSGTKEKLPAKQPATQKLAPKVVVAKPVVQQSSATPKPVQPKVTPVPVAKPKHTYAELVAHYTQYYIEHYKLTPEKAKQQAEAAALKLAPPPVKKAVPAPIKPIIKAQPKTGYQLPKVKPAPTKPPISTPKAKTVSKPTLKKIPAGK